MPSPDVGAVVIGRNEGKRLSDCLNSLTALIPQTVYVDSGSSDGSLVLAKSMGALVVALDMAEPFTAARARNAGFDELLRRHSHVRYIQFVDGDCALSDRWIGTARDFLLQRPDVALVFGRRRERYPERSVFNALCDAEWNTPLGLATECGGDSLVRADAFALAEGFSGDLIAGEEPELCVRLREAGWTIWRLDCEMTRHDANIMRLRQWWRRCVRGGHAFAEVASRHRNSPASIWRPNVRRAVIWAGVIPPLAIAGALLHPFMLALLALYPLQVLRLVRRRGLSRQGSWSYAVLLVLAKFPELQGITGFYKNLLFRRRPKLIEYK